MFYHQMRAVCFGVLCCAIALAAAAEDNGLAARAEAGKSGKFLVAFFFDQKSDAAKTSALRASVQESVQALAEKICPVFIDIDDSTQQGLVKEFNLRYAPRPIVLVLAPGGAVTGSFQKPFTANELSESLPGPGMQRAIKALQERKLVLLRVENADSAGAAAVAEAAKGFLEDSRFKENAIQIVIDPNNPEERNSLRQLQINTSESGTDTPTESGKAAASGDKTKVRPAVSLLLAPPGMMVGRWEGAVTKDAFVQGLMQAMARSGGCGSGCTDPACPPTPQEGKK